MGITEISSKELEKLRKQRAENLRKEGRPGQHEQFLYEQEVTPEELEEYKAAIEMGDTEYKLGTKGYPKPRGPKFGAKPFTKKATGGIVKTKKKKKKMKKPRGVGAALRGYGRVSR